MPGFDGQKLVSETRVLAKNQARVVITIEVELGIDTMKAMPAWQRSAIGYLREMLQEHTSPEGILAELEDREGVYVTSEKIEVYG